MGVLIMADGAYRWLGNAPAPDPARVEAIHAACDDSDVAAFGESARAAAVERMDRALAAARSGDLADASAPLAQARATLAALNASDLEPRRGLAGLFDSRKKRLKRFRQTYAQSVAALVDATEVMVARVEAATRRSAGLDVVWAEMRDAVTDLDAHLSAAARRLSGQAASADAPPHPMRARRATLDACRSAALQSLTLIRGVQNADARAAEALKRCGDGVATWRDGWKAALGLAGKRPRKVRPDPAQLTTMRDDLLTRIDRAMVELASTSTRRAEIGNRMSAVRTSP